MSFIRFVLKRIEIRYMPWQTIQWKSSVNSEKKSVIYTSRFHRFHYWWMLIFWINLFITLFLLKKWQKESDSYKKRHVEACLDRNQNFTSYDLYKFHMWQEIWNNNSRYDDIFDSSVFYQKPHSDLGGKIMLQIKKRFIHIQSSFSTVWLWKELFYGHKLSHEKKSETSTWFCYTSLFSEQSVVTRCWIEWLTLLYTLLLTFFISDGKQLMMITN